MILFIFVFTLIERIRLTDLTAKYDTFLLDPIESLTSEQKDEIYKEYITLYNKKASTTRNQIFKDTLDEIIAHNSDKKNTWKKGINEYTDMSHEDFAKYYLPKASQNCSATIGNHIMSNKALPEFIDWRLKHVISYVKSQGKCGSCWTFSTTGCLEAHYRIHLNKPVILSEQQLLDCASNFDNHGCKGGLPSHAFEYIKSVGGLESGDVYPYKAQVQDCKFDSKYIAAQVPYGSVNITALDENALADAIAHKGPVSVAFHAIKGFKDYRSGVYSSPDCKNGPKDVNHAVLAVGYGTENGQDYYIIKNSWGANWGDKGYFKILRNTNMCGIAMCNAYPNIGQAIELANTQSLEI